MNYQADVNVLSSPILKIEKNIIEMDDAIIQIKNVASVSLRYPPKYGYSPYAIGIFIISFYIFFYTVTAAEIKFTSFMFLISAAISGYMLYRTWEKNKNLGKNIIISTGSGISFWINSKDDEFSLKVIDVIRNIMNGYAIENEIIINLEKLDITNHGIIVYADQSKTSYSDISDSIIGSDNKVSISDADEYPELKI